MRNGVVDLPLLHRPARQTQIGRPTSRLLAQHFVEIDGRLTRMSGFDQRQAQRQAVIDAVRRGKRIAVSLNGFLIAAALQQLFRGPIVTVGAVGAFQAEEVIQEAHQQRHGHQCRHYAHE